MVANRRVLVMDDEDVVCRSYERVLTNAGFEVGKAHTGRDALDQMRNNPYDVMLADLKMPGMDGLSVIRKVRETHPDIPVIVITGYPSKDTMEEATRLGVTDYMTKPVAPEVLTQVANNAMTAAPWPGITQSTNTVWPTVGTVAAPTAIPPPAPEVMAAPTAVTEAVKEAIGRVGKRLLGILQTVAALIAAPLVGLAYVMFLPFIGFAVVLGLGTKALVRKITSRGA